MKPHSEPERDTSRFAPPRPMEAYPRSSIRKIAVLFTDVVGSTRFFKELGDVAGREMLQQHQDIASSPIVEHGGFVVKTLGDSIMAYFMDPKEAVKSAIKIQQRFLRHNQRQDADHHILVRIGIHFGEGIVEDHDIFGNVVNLAAKIVPMAGRDQIFVSQEIQTQVTGLSTVGCEKVAVPEKTSDLEGLDIYQITWDPTVHFDPTTNILLFLKPLWRLAGPGFQNTWTRVIDTEKTPWVGRSINVFQQEKDSIILVFKQISSAIEVARTLLGRFQEHHGNNPPSPNLPVQLLIDSGPYLRADRIVLDDADIKWHEIHPGNIYISSSAFRLAKNKNSLRTDPPFDYDHPRPVYRLLEDQQAIENSEFLYRTALVSGRHSVCFYCGSRQHIPQNCPSKKLIHPTRSLKKLGYTSTEAINGMFLEHMMAPRALLEAAPSPDHQVDDSSLLAQHAFYELKSIVQHRFFRNIWDSFSNSWDEVKAIMDSGEKGGQIWLALDLIRTSRLVKAESLLNTLMLQESQDYRVFCTVGFLYLEQNQCSKAEWSFERALMFAKTKPQRIFILFLLARLFEVRGSLPRAEEKIEEILRLHPSCVDARYQRVLYRFHRGQDKRALAGLTKLIHEQKEFYVKALIDPELAPFSTVVNQRLQRLFGEIKTKAEHLYTAAVTEKQRQESLRGDEECVDEEMQSLWEKAGQAFHSESYFGYLEVIRIADLVTSRCRMTIADWKKKIGRQLAGLGDQLQTQMAFIQTYPYPFMTLGILKQLKLIQEKLKQIQNIVADEEVDRFKEAYAQAIGLSKQIEAISPWLKRLDMVRKSVYFLVSFFKVSLTLQTANLLVGIILLPVVSHYVTVAFPDLKSLDRNLWFYQKGCLTVGGAIAFLMAILKPLKKLSQHASKI